MTPKRAGDLTKGLIVDIDGVLSGQVRPIEERHSAAASAAILAVRLIGGACINLARLTTAAERIARIMEDDRSTDARPSGNAGLGEADDGVALP